MQERLIPDVTAQIQQFYRWLTDNKLTTTEIALWHALLYVAIKAGYPVWLSIPLSKLEKCTGAKKDAIYRARDGLVEKNLIEFQSGKGSRAAKYRIIPFQTKSAIDESSATISPVESHKETDRVTIFGRIQDLILMPSPMDIHNIKKYMEEGMEEELLIEAINISERELQNKSPSDKWRYAKGIIRNWYNDEIKTLGEYRKHEKERRNQLNGIGRKNNKSLWSKSSKNIIRSKPSGMRKFRIPN